LTRPPRRAARDAAGSSYDERLAVPWWGWPATLAVSVLLAAQLHSGQPGALAVAPYVVVPVLLIGTLLVLSRDRVRVAGGVLHVRGARLPVEVVGGVAALDREQTRRVRGPLADPRAYVVTRPWLPCAVRVVLDDPADDTPYWLVGTRRPQELAAALEAAARP
jgi:hypothetical protein